MMLLGDRGLKRPIRASDSGVDEHKGKKDDSSVLSQSGATKRHGYWPVMRGLLLAAQRWVETVRKN